MKRRNLKPKTRPKRKPNQKPNGQPKRKSKLSSSERNSIQQESKPPVSVVNPPEIDLASLAAQGIKAEDPPNVTEARDEVQDTANFADVTSEDLDLENIFEVHVEIEESVTTAETRDTKEPPTALLETYDGTEIPTIPVATPVNKTGGGLPSVVDRRAHPRYNFTAAVEVSAPDGGVRCKAQLRDLSQQGCYVDMNDPLALGAAVDLRITRGAIAFEAGARVVFTQAGKGMGLSFTHVEAEQLKTLNGWIAESRQSSWRATNRRRSQRALMRIPVRVSGESADGAGFVERTHTLSISAHGALVIVNTPVNQGQRFILSNIATGAALECVVVNMERTPNGPVEVGVEFTLPNPNFWRVAFPPRDWTPRHPDAKSS